MPAKPVDPTSVKTQAPFVIRYPEAQIIRALRKHGQISRTDIAQVTGWSRAKIGAEVDELIRKGFLKEVGVGNSEGGRRPRLLSINDHLGYILGVDIGATSVDVALADACGQVLLRAAEPADVRSSPEQVLGRCVALALGLLDRQKAQARQVLGIGVGVPGPVDFAHGVLVAPPLMPEWEGYPIGEFFAGTFPAAFVLVDNDVNIMALGELRSGRGIGLDHFIFVKIGTGIGAGIVSGGRVHRGFNGCAGDIGHICVDKQGPVCRCSNRGCLEAMAAGPAIAARATEAAQRNTSPVLARRYEANGGWLSPEDVGAALREGDPVALEIIQNSGRLIGEVLASLINFFNPSHIFVGGGVTSLGNQLLASMRQTVLGRSTPLATRHLMIDYSVMGAEAGITGAVSLALDHLFIWEDACIELSV